MKKYLILALAVGMASAFTSCKSSESAYRKAYEKARAQEAQAGTTAENTTVAVQPTTPTTTTTVTVPQTPVQEDLSDTRTINGGVTVISGNGLKAFSVVVGSFSAQPNADGLQAQLKKDGFEAQVVKSNETINGITGWYRVVASTYADKASAIRSRDELRTKYKDAWLLYNK